MDKHWDLTLTFFLCAMCFWFGGFFEHLKTKESYCKQSYEKHKDVDECQGKPFPWKEGK